MRFARRGTCRAALFVDLEICRLKWVCVDVCDFGECVVVVVFSHFRPFLLPPFFFVFEKEEEAADVDFFEAARRALFF